jgi:actinorhodin biosynthesis protein ActVIA
MTAAADHLDLDIAYTRVQRFYAAQMRRLDERDIQGYARTFTTDAEFAHTPGHPPSRTRSGIIEDLIAFSRRFDDDPMQRRHVVTMIDLSAAGDGSLISAAYCLVIKIRRGQEPAFTSCVMRDVLVEADGELLTRSRHIDYD